MHARLRQGRIIVSVLLRSCLKTVAAQPCFATQVQATVNFSIKPGGTQPPSPFPMTAQPSQLIIPANESRFMAVHFSPTAIRSYSATFEAVVENGGDAATRSFSCELRGEGTLPSLTLELPQTDKGPQGLKFPRLLMVGLLSEQRSINTRFEGTAQVLCASRDGLR